jgi:RecA-family ATPase
MPKNLSKQGALQVTHDLDRLANLYQSEFETLGVTEKIATDFATKCDILSDILERRAGVERNENGDLKDAELARYASSLGKQAQMDPKSNYTMEDIKPGEFDPAEIGEEQADAILRNSDEPYMDVFRQDEFDQLRQVQQDGMFSNAKAASAAMAKMAKLLSDAGIKVPVSRK